MPKSKHSTFHIVAAIWLILATLYFINNEWRRLNTVVQQSQEAGFATAVNGVINQAQACESFRVFSGDASVELINVACIQGENDQAQPSQ